MKRLYVLLFCIFLVGSVAKPCFSGESGNLPVDGDAWESWSSSHKAGWLIGFAEGMKQASRETSFFLMLCGMGVKLKFTGTMEGAQEVAEELYNEFVERIFPGKASGEQIFRGLDEFYKDYRNKNILVREATYVVELEVMGAPQEFIEQITRILRIPFEDRGKEQKSLLEGYKEYKLAFEKWGRYLPYTLVPTASN